MFSLAQAHLAEFYNFHNSCLRIVLVVNSISTSDPTMNTVGFLLPPLRTPGDRRKTAGFYVPCIMKNGDLVLMDISFYIKAVAPQENMKPLHFILKTEFSTNLIWTHFVLMCLFSIRIFIFWVMFLTVEMCNIWNICII